jgi:hypothetical protein
MAIKRNYIRTQTSYGLSEPLIGVAAAPIVQTRNPTTSDFAEIGRAWINKSTAGYWVCAKIAGNSATWASGATSADAFTTTGAIIAGTTLAATTTLAVGTTAVIGTGLTVSAGGITSTGTIGHTGNIIASTSIAAGTTLAAGTTIVAGTTITATLGNITATNGYFVSTVATKGFRWGTTGAQILSGTGSPNASVSATQGSIFIRTDGDKTTTLYFNNNGITGWTAIAGA